MAHCVMGYSGFVEPDVRISSLVCSNERVKPFMGASPIPTPHSLRMKSKKPLRIRRLAPRAAMGLYRGSCVAVYSPIVDSKDVHSCSRWRKIDCTR